MAVLPLSDKLNVTLPPEKAYGVRNENLVQKLPRDQFKLWDFEAFQAGALWEPGQDQVYTRSSHSRLCLQDRSLILVAPLLLKNGSTVHLETHLG